MILSERGRGLKIIINSQVVNYRHLQIHLGNQVKSMNNIFIFYQDSISRWSRSVWARGLKDQGGGGEYIIIMYHHVIYCICG